MFKVPTEHAELLAEVLDKKFKYQIIIHHRVDHSILECKELICISDVYPIQTFIDGFELGINSMEIVLNDIQKHLEIMNNKINQV